MKKIVINADDFGISEGVNRGILKCHKDGVLKSTSLMANLGAFESAVQIAQTEQELGVGIHLNLTCGSPVAPMNEISSIISDKGIFFTLPRLINKLVRKRISLTDVESEFSAQIKKVIDSGITPTHLDTHHHIHFFPPIRKIVDRLAHRYQIKWVRGTSCYTLKGFYFSLPMAFNKGLYSGLAKRFILSNLGRISQTTLNNSVHYPQQVLGIGYIPTGKYQKAFIHFLKKPIKGLTEIVCHPGYVDNELIQNDTWVHMREEELETLISADTSDIVNDLDLEILNYRH